MHQNCISSGKSCKMYTIFTMFSRSGIYILTFFVADIYMNIAKIRNLQLKLRFKYVGSV